MIEILPILERPETAPVVAEWHHSEWSTYEPIRTPDERGSDLLAPADETGVPQTFVAFDDGVPVGSASLVRDDLPTRPDLQPWLASVYVIPTARRRGIAGRLVRQVVRAAAASGIARLHLFTPDQAALYARLGWREIDRSRHAGHEQVVMALDTTVEARGAEGSAADSGDETRGVRIVWSDETIVCVDKPSGSLVHNAAFAGPKERSLRQEVGRVLHRRVYPVHRLDRGTSGALLFATEPEHVSGWQAALSEPTSEKWYVALVRGRLSESIDIDRPVPRSSGERVPARTHVEPIAVSEADRCALVRVRLHTGRHRQARRHLAGISHPILGDSSLGDSRENRRYRAAWGLDRLALHAWRLVVHHPLTGQRLTFEAPLDARLASVVARLFPDGVAI